MTVDEDEVEAAEENFYCAFAGKCFSFRNRAKECTLEDKAIELWTKYHDSRGWREFLMLIQVFSDSYCQKSDFKLVIRNGQPKILVRRNCKGTFRLCYTSPSDRCTESFTCSKSSSPCVLAPNARRLWYKYIQSGGSDNWNYKIVKHNVRPSRRCPRSAVQMTEHRNKPALSITANCEETFWICFYHNASLKPAGVREPIQCWFAGRFTSTSNRPTVRPMNRKALALWRRYHDDEGWISYLSLVQKFQRACRRNANFRLGTNGTIWVKQCDASFVLCEIPSSAECKFAGRCESPTLGNRSCPLSVQAREFWDRMADSDDTMQPRLLIDKAFGNERCQENVNYWLNDHGVNKIKVASGCSATFQLCFEHKREVASYQERESRNETNGEICRFAGKCFSFNGASTNCSLTTRASEIWRRYHSNNGLEQSLVVTQRFSEVSCDGKTSLLGGAGQNPPVINVRGDCRASFTLCYVPVSTRCRNLGSCPSSKRNLPNRTPLVCDFPWTARRFWRAQRTAGNTNSFLDLVEADLPNRCETGNGIHYRETQQNGRPQITLTNGCRGNFKICFSMQSGPQGDEPSVVRTVMGEPSTKLPGIVITPTVQQSICVLYDGEKKQNGERWTIGCTAFLCSMGQIEREKDRDTCKENEECVTGTCVCKQGFEWQNGMCKAEIPQEITV